MTKWPNTLRVWRGTPASLAAFLKNKPDRKVTETVAVYETANRVLHMWSYGDLGPETIEALQLRKVDTIQVEATLAGRAA